MNGYYILKNVLEYILNILYTRMSNKNRDLMIKRLEKEAKMHQALSEYDLANKTDKKVSIAEIARRYSIPRRTFSERIMKPRNKFTERVLEVSAR